MAQFIYSMQKVRKAVGDKVILDEERSVPLMVTSDPGRPTDEIDVDPETGEIFDDPGEDEVPVSAAA